MHLGQITLLQMHPHLGQTILPPRIAASLEATVLGNWSLALLTGTLLNPNQLEDEILQLPNRYYRALCRLESNNFLFGSEYKTRLLRKREK